MSLFRAALPAFRSAVVRAPAARVVRCSAQRTAVRGFAVKVGETRYTKDHEWVRLTKAGEAQVGITDFAQSALGDVVFVDLPEVGAKFTKGDAFGSVESVKAASSIYAPVTMQVSGVNEAVKNDNSLVNSSAAKDGWMIQVKLSKPEELDALLDEAAYEKVLADSKH